MAAGMSLVLKVGVVTFVVMTPLILLGAYAGFYAGGTAGLPGYLLAIVFSTVGFLVGFFIVTRVIVLLVKRSARP